jgi:uncharacterized protein
MTESSKQIDFSELRTIIVRQFYLGKKSLHGPEHWARVRQIGERLCETTGADLTVVRLFSVFHDSKRANEGHDPEHGARGAAFARELRGQHFSLDDERFEKLVYACTWHTAGKLHTDPTIGTCWDSDRLDLWRVGVYPRAELLCTSAAREKKMIKWATGLVRD